METGKGKERVQDNQGRDEYLSILGNMARIGTQPFRGGPDLTIAKEWQCRLRRNLEATQCPTHLRKDVSVHFLEGDAYLWWLTVEGRVKGRADSGVGFEEEFNRRYLPAEALENGKRELLVLAQGNKTVREYEREFLRLLQIGGEALEDNNTQARRFLGGLRTDIKIPCSVSTYGSIAELAERAVIVEGGLVKQDGNTLESDEEEETSGWCKRNGNITKWKN